MRKVLTARAFHRPASGKSKQSIQHAENAPRHARRRTTRATWWTRPDRGGQLIDASWNHAVGQVDDLCTVALSGELDTDGFEELCSILADAVGRPGVAAVHVDLAGLDFLDSAGIRALLTAYHHAQMCRRTFTVTRARGTVHRVLEIAGLLPILCAEPGSFDEAAGAQSQPA